MPNKNIIKNTGVEKFRISGKKVLLTYPQCSIKLETALEQLKNKLATYVLADYLLVKQRDLSLDIFLKFKQKVSIRNKNFLNLKEGEFFIGGGSIRGARTKTQQ